MPGHENHDLIQLYRSSFAEYGDTPAGVQWPKGRQDLRFDALTRHFSCDGFSVLDYGCGLAHLKPYLDHRFSQYEYRGVDLVPEFLVAVENKFPKAKVQLINSYHDVSDPVDHVVISGTFNIMQGTSREAYWETVKQTLKHLFAVARVSLAVNFMTDRVDFTQPQAFHVSMEAMMEFVQTHMSPRLLADASYMPYEFTLVVLKDSEIIRPDNIYRPL